MNFQRAQEVTPMVSWNSKAKLLLMPALFILVLSLIACGAGYRTVTVNGEKKVYKVDEEGSKTLVYQVHKDGTTTVHDEKDPMYQQHAAQEGRVEEAKRADAARLERIKHAPKRRASAPILVALHATELGENMKKAEHTRGAVHEQIRKELTSDKVIKLVSRKDLEREELAQLARALAGKSPNSSPVADVEVRSRVYLKETVGINRKTGKMASMPLIHFEATITSTYLPAEYKVHEKGTAFQNVQATKRFANEIKRVIKKEIGPTLPADRTM
jgi:hypothetical protein